MQCTDHVLIPPKSNGYIRCCVNSTAAGSLTINLKAVDSLSFSVTADWTMYLMRYDNGVWRQTGQSRTGYVNSGSPSTRTFTGLTRNRRYKVLIHYEKHWKNSPSVRYVRESKELRL